MLAAFALGGLLAVGMPSKLPYETYCASCHGDDLRGTPDGPSLRGAGAAALDFWMVTGRMPAAVPWIEVGHRGAQLPPATIAAIEAYAHTIDPSGPPIPEVTAGGELHHGRAVFEQNCEHCHGVDGSGASVGGNQWAPALHDTSIVQVAEAIRVGPGEMPRFGERQLSARDLRDVASYVFKLDVRADKRALPLSSSGPVPEGLLGWLAITLLCVLAFAFSKNR